ncbi:MAG: hypothetical protein IPO78_07885 [Saprospiraceae bacterium]|nr:hypothetical protein [Saprospiraceae bacterium]MBK8449812.1 hypothetical protein [Saprospiraceae bacterium]MBK8484129.1 hypothetical protein [Saprospiraceae bacterium]MBK9221534.1 hypothetical protein [Saprospiraceae bacterium]MBK9721529.1 hypothetical protein [Saprospiraceae bacterium]
MELRIRSFLLILGFILFVVGLLSLILSLVSIRLSFMVPIDDLGYLKASIIKLIMVVSGIILVYFMKSNR